LAEAMDSLYAHISFLSARNEGLTATE